MSRDDTLLFDIVNAAREALLFTQGMDEATFRKDMKTQSAVFFKLMVIGEAVKGLSPEFRAQYPAIPWTQIAGMRDRLIHGYNAINLGRVWQTVLHDVPSLLRTLEPLLPQEPSP